MKTKVFMLAHSSRDFSWWRDGTVDHKMCITIAVTLSITKAGVFLLSPFYPIPTAAPPPTIGSVPATPWWVCSLAILSGNASADTPGNVPPSPRCSLIQEVENEDSPSQWFYVLASFPYLGSFVLVYVFFVLFNFFSHDLRDAHMSLLPNPSLWDAT